MTAFNPKFTITNRMTAAITRIERARGFLEAARLSDDWVRDMGNKALIKEAHHTTHIEGARLTLDQAQRLWNGDAVPEADPDDTRELLNYRSAFEFVSDCLDSGDPITEGLIREIHRKLVEGVRGGKADPGNYRRIQNYVANSSTGEVIYTPPSAVDVPILMSDMVKWLNADLEIHPALISGIAQFQLVHIHPFLDGNGRASRLLSTLCLYKAGYDFKRLFTISEYYDRDRPTFYKSIQSARDNGIDMTGWLDYFITGLETQMIEVKERGEQIIRRDALAQKHSLNQRQAKALDLLMKRTSAHISEIEEICLGVTRRTLQRDMNGLMDLKLVRITGSARQSNYEFIK
ncbi:Cell division protein Fic [Candidatus Desulfarcum epimagneticum]|uniref:Cell division protein Fic n=1 Tax=uncultured Desulfobacteraceae bacterium TaxID=218296 RepID=A0A484HB59_9BACT|nr:Cell division protein Fic [uncultured Desulfobacteraceae bacterium]